TLRHTEAGEQNCMIAPAQPISRDGTQHLRIEGGASLRGAVSIAGAKNAALPIMAAALLTPEPCVIHNIPWIADIETLAPVLTSLGAQVAFATDHQVICSSDGLCS